MVVLSSSLRHKMILWLTVLLLASCRRADADELLENIAYTQYDGESFCPSTPEDELNAPLLVGGDDFFNWQYAGIIQQVEELGASLKEIEITSRSYAPDFTPMLEMYRLLVKDFPGVQKMFVLLGASFDLLFCYENGLQKACGERHRTLYETTSTIWVYSYQCETWGAQFTDTAVKTFASGNVTKVVLSVVLDIQNVDINQCPTSDQPVFSASSLCDADISECRPVNGSGFKVGEYSCICTECAECGEISGSVLSDPYENGSELLKAHCTVKKQVDGVQAGPPQQLLIGVLAANGVCILICMILAAIVLAFESSQVIQSSNCLILEMILLGAILKYVMLVLRLLPQSAVICTLMPWLAELSFTLMYGAVVLKLYKSKSKRYLPSRPVINPLLVGVCVAVLYLAAWTCTAWSYSVMHGISLVDRGDYCLFTFWEFSRPAVEVLFLGYGLVIAVRRRNTPTAYGEWGWYTAVLAVELILIIIYLTVTLLLQSALVEELIYHHLTTLLSLLFVFLPKLVYMCKRQTKQLPTSDGNSHSTADMKELDIDDLSHDQAKAKLREATEELEILREKVRCESDRRPPPVSPRSNAGNVRGDEQELEPLNPSRPQVKSSNNQVSF